MQKKTAVPQRSRVTLVVALTLLGLVSLSATGVSQEGGSLPSSRALAGGGSELPVTAVSLFTTGVGYFQHDGFVEGTEAVALTFAAGDIDDILKSLVIQDFDGGTVEASYPSQEPVERILGSFSIDIADNPSLAELLTRARGEMVEVEVPEQLSGTVSGVEYRSRVTDGATERVPFLVLQTGSGLRQVSLYELRTLRFTDLALQAELDAALAVIADNRQEERKTVTVRFSGEGRRRVRVAYIREVPVWKTSYRMVLADDGTAQLQGWAIVENTGESDWRDVTLRLAASQPISFVMDLYSPIYRERPRVSPQLSANVAPQEYDRGVAPAPSVARSSGAAPMFDMAEEALAFEPPNAEPEPIDLGAGVSSAANFEPGAVYRISEPVSIPRRGAALIPIVQAEIPASRVSIYNRGVLANRPLGGVRFENATGLQLPAGPATIFDGANYAGDAQLPQTVAGEKRLLSYAVDLQSAVLTQTQAEPTTITQITISSGAIRVTRESRSTTGYTVERLSEEAVTLVIEHPRRSGWELLSPRDPVEELAGAYRFELTVDGGRTETFEVEERSARVQSLSLRSLSEADLQFYITNGEIDASTRRTLERVQTLRAAVAEAQTERRFVEREIATITREQERIRENLAVVESGTTLYQRYIDTLTEQEDRLAQLQRELSAAAAEEREANDALGSYIDGL